MTVFRFISLSLSLSLGLTLFVARSHAFTRLQELTSIINESITKLRPKKKSEMMKKLMARMRDQMLEFGRCYCVPSAAFFKWNLNTDKTTKANHMIIPWILLFGFWFQCRCFGAVRLLMAQFQWMNPRTGFTWNVMVIFSIWIATTKMPTNELKPIKETQRDKLCMHLTVFPADEFLSQSVCLFFFFFVSISFCPMQKRLCLSASDDDHDHRISFNSYARIKI